jgi:hypothetical protein
MFSTNIKGMEHPGEDWRTLSSWLSQFHTVTFEIVCGHRHCAVQLYTFVRQIVGICKQTMRMNDVSYSSCNTDELSS